MSRLALSNYLENCQCISSGSIILLRVLMFLYKAYSIFPSCKTQDKKKRHGSITTTQGVVFINECDGIFLSDACLIWNQLNHNTRLDSPLNKVNVASIVYIVWKYCLCVCTGSKMPQLCVKLKASITRLLQSWSILGFFPRVVHIPPADLSTTYTRQHCCWETKLPATPNVWSWLGQQQCCSE